MQTTLSLAAIPQSPTREVLISFQVVAGLFQELNHLGIRYCHWKSNLRMERGLSGHTDLDLLVDRQHEQAFKKVLAEFSIKPFLAPPGKRYPAIEDYLGFDPTGGRLFHLHVHFELVLGEQYVKNYRLPLEDWFLDHTRLHYGVKIPAPELELIVLCMRALLKYRDRDVIKDVLSIRSPGLKEEMVDEINWLLGQTSLEKVSQALGKIADIVPGEIILDFLKIVTSTARAGVELYYLRSRLRNELLRYQRRNSLRATTNYFHEAWRRRKSFWKFTPDKKMTLINGGKSFALVGADGAGKSTLTAEFSHWLGWRVDVHNYYLGSKQPSWLSTLLYWLFRIARRGHRTVSRMLSEKNIVAELMHSVRQIMLYGHYLSTGYDRYLRYQAGQERAENGSIVVFDRFPLQAPLDGPQIHMVADGKLGRIGNLLSVAEQNLYRKMQHPDCLIVLEVDPDVSMLRKPDHKRTSIEGKSQLLGELIAKLQTSPTGPKILRLNANLPLEDVLSQLKQYVWETL